MGRSLGLLRSLPWAAFALFHSAMACFPRHCVRGVPTTPVLGPPGAVDGSDFLGVRRFRFRETGFPYPWSFAALVYARMVGDEQLIEHYQTPEPAPEREPADSTAGPLDGSVSNGKKWTPEKLDEVAAFRKKHGTKKAAEHFKVSEQLIRQKLPSAKPKPKGYSAFTHRTK